MDTKLSFIIRGLIGVIFGLLTLFFPDITRGTFITIFGVLVIGGILLSLFLATTSSSEETMFWFGVSVLLLVIGIVAFFIHNIIEIIFILIIAGWAFYIAFTGISFAISQPRTKYSIIIGMFVICAIIQILIYIYAPILLKDPILMVLGIFAMVFGLFSLLMGWYIHEESIKGHVNINKE
ncbi:MAG: hypothetical protein ABR887_00095 [Methanoregulaceae archaeon]|jgi:uncharacterized membrane protein HdeD (DUF308 family)